MKYIVILGDGMADDPVLALGGKTPLEVAKKPNIDRLCALGETGLVQTVPAGMKPGSDVANLSVLGYPPQQFYTGRSPLEALSIGVDLAPEDVAIRCNLVTLSDAEPFCAKTMLDYSAGEIDTAEAAELIHAVGAALGTATRTFYPGVSYRHCFVEKGGTVAPSLVPPHDISDRVIGDYLPSDAAAAPYLDLMRLSEDILKNHPVNVSRVQRGLRPATHIWLWGAGTKPALPSFVDTFGLKGAMISAVDLLKGIATAAKMRVINVPHATGTLTTNFVGKAQAAVVALTDGCDYVYVHLEAPDECGHQGDVFGKVKAIEKVDEVVGLVADGLSRNGLAFTMLVTPDHGTPLAKKTHVSDPVPFVLYRSNHCGKGSGATYTEQNARAAGLLLPEGRSLIERMLTNKA